MMSNRPKAFVALLHELLDVVFRADVATDTDRSLEAARRLGGGVAVDVGDDDVGPR